MLRVLFLSRSDFEFIYLLFSMQVPINPYGKAKKMSEDIILDYSKTSNMAVMILRYRNSILHNVLQASVFRTDCKF